ncbi:MAG: hypothetical protein IJI03_21770, partial [Rudaea sp.]|nr:hypothetical protein [Rudaea sp.]
MNLDRQIGPRRIVRRGEHPGESQLRIELAELARERVGQLVERMQEAQAHLLGSEAAEEALERFDVVGADRTQDQRRAVAR